MSRARPSVRPDPQAFRFHYHVPLLRPGSFEAEWCPRTRRLRIQENILEEPSEHPVTERRWQAFWRKLDKMGAWRWPEEIGRQLDSIAEDAPSWEIEVVHGSRRLRLEGYHRPPTGQKGPRPFAPLIRAIKSLTAAKR